MWTQLLVACSLIPCSLLLIVLYVFLIRLGSLAYRLLGIAGREAVLEHSTADFRHPADGSAAFGLVTSIL